MTAGTRVTNEEPGPFRIGLEGIVLYDRGGPCGIRVRWVDGRESWMSPANLTAAGKSGVES